MATCGSNSGPFFRFSNGDPLTKSKFTKEVQNVQQALSLPYADFAGHSFRTEEATAAARAEVEDLLICTLGRWNSSAFLAYIRTPRDQLAQFSKQCRKTGMDLFN